MRYTPRKRTVASGRGRGQVRRPCLRSFGQRPRAPGQNAALAWRILRRRRSQRGNARTVRRRIPDRGWGSRPAHQVEYTADEIRSGLVYEGIELRRRVIAPRLVYGRRSQTQAVPARQGATLCQYTPSGGRPNRHTMSSIPPPRCAQRDDESGGQPPAPACRRGKNQPVRVGSCCRGIRVRWRPPRRQPMCGAGRIVWPWTS